MCSNTCITINPNYVQWTRRIYSKLCKVDEVFSGPQPPMCMRKIKKNQRSENNVCLSSLFNETTTIEDLARFLSLQLAVSIPYW